MIRVDNYVCHTAVVSTDGASPSPPSNRQNEPGSSSDSNQDTPLPPGSEVYRHENNVRYIEEMIQKMEKLQQRHQRQLIQLRYVSAIPDPQHETSPKLLPISSVELISRQKLFIYKLTHPKFKIKSKMLQEAMLRWKNKLQPPIPEQPPSDGTNMDAAIEKGLSNLESINPEDVIATEQNCKPRIIRTNTLLKPGMKFVTIFCDDNKVTSTKSYFCC